MDREKLYTSTSPKLYNYLDRLKNIKDLNKWQPINLQIAPTEKCNLNCSFCSVKERGHEELSIESILQAIVEFKQLGLLSVEITGGGDPTLYPKINELILFCKALNLKVGLITNGILLKDKIEQFVLDKLDWLRISLNGIDEGKWPAIPKINGTLGFSYVWNSKSNEKILGEIYKKYGCQYSSYIRIVPNCLEPKEQITLRDTVAKLVKDNNYEDKMFVQTKDYSIHDKCYIGNLKPFLYTDGYIYQCSAVALYNRRFDERWRICHMSEINNHWPFCNNLFDNSMCEKGKCFYCDQNKILDDLQMEVDKNGFI